MPVMPGNLARRTRRFQVKALLLLAVFLAAGTSLPSLDAVLYHSQGSEVQRWQSHVEDAGGCLDHSEHCVLGRTAPGSSAAAAHSGAIRTEPTRRPTPHRLPPQPQVAADRGTVPQPRAPPASLV
jgi:hypothetical protein